VGYEPELSKGERRIWIEEAVADRLTAIEARGGMPLAS